jgi:hypothetical protein
MMFRAAFLARSRRLQMCVMTDPRPFDILQSGPGWWDRMPFDQLHRREFITLLSSSYMEVTKPSCLISCSHRSPEGSLSVFVGRHGAMNPAGRVRCNMRTK